MEYTLRDLSTESALQTALELHNVELSDEEEVKFFADMNWVCPLGMLIGTNAMRSFRDSYPDNSFSISMNEKEDAVSYAGHMGFFKSISESIAVGNAPGEAPGNDNYIPITKIDLTQIHRDNLNAGIWGEMGDSIELKSAELSKILCRANKEMQKLITYLIREILRNIPEHAEALDAWICGQYWSNNIAEIAILDTGIGVKTSLQKNPTHRSYITDDITALQCAIKEGISQAFNPARGNRSQDVWSNSGYGLFMVSEICKRLNGSFCIASGDSYIYIDSDEKLKVSSTYINGTAIMMRFSTAELHNSNAIIQEIAGQGEVQARTIKNAFKKASQPSKGLITDID